MNRRMTLPLAVVALAAVVVACAAGSGGLGPVPTPPASPAASVTQPSPDTTPTLPSASPSTSPAASPTLSPTPSTGPSPSPAGTTVVRAYFILADGPTGGGGLVPALSEVPATKAVATAAMTALLEGPGPLRDAAQTISTAIPPGTKLLGITIADGVATVDLSGEFESGGGSASVFSAASARSSNTLTQFPTVSAVTFRVDGRPVDVFSSEGVIVDHPLTRSDFEDQLPAIFVDRPAWGASLGNPARVAGTANVFEAQFRVAIVGADGTVRGGHGRHGHLRHGLPRQLRRDDPVPGRGGRLGHLARLRPVREGREPAGDPRVPGLPDRPLDRPLSMSRARPTGPGSMIFDTFRHELRYAVRRCVPAASCRCSSSSRPAAASRPRSSPVTSRCRCERSIATSRPWPNRGCPSTPSADPTAGSASSTAIAPASRA